MAVRTSHADDYGSSELYHRFLENAISSPDTVAMIDDASGNKMTYRHLYGDSLNLAARLVATISLVYEEPVSILMGRCIEQVVAQLAILRHNGCCVPIDPELPLQRRETMLNELQIRCVLLLDTEAPSNIRIYIRHVNPLKTPRTTVQSPQDQCTHIIHTSGTTGPPKAVQLPARGLLRLVSNNHFKIWPCDRIAHLSLPFFDASLLEVWTALSSGATLVVLSPQTIRDSKLFQNALEHHHISVAFVTAALFNSISLALPEAFSSLHILLSGGEAANIQAVERVLRHASPSLSFFNLYGPTESSVCATSHRLSLEDVQSGNIPIGVPYDDTTTLRVVNHRGLDVVGIEKGELYIGGGGLAVGYLNQPELTSEKFVVMDGLRWYRTGDQVWWKDGIVGGVLQYSGRLDNQIKLRGFRFELEEIDNSILASGLVASVTTVLIRPDGAEPFIVAFIVPNDVVFSTGDAKSYLQLRFPEYMVPRFHLCDQLPLTANGKVDRKELTAQYLDAIGKVALVDDRLNVPKVDFVSLLARIWKEVLVVPGVSLDDDFFDIGGSSISAATVVYQYRRTSGREIPVGAIYEHKTIRKIAALLEEDENPGVPSMVPILLADSRLADAINPPATEGIGSFEGMAPGNTVFLTGATGFLGVYLLAELLRSSPIDAVFCLVRAPDDVAALARIEGALHRYRLWDTASPSLSKVHAVSGYLEGDTFGLSNEVFHRIVREVKVIYHLGAKVKYTEPYASHQPTNVIGTRNVIQLACQSPSKVIHYVSSVASFGPIGLSQPKGYVSEEAPLHPYLPNMDYDLGYAQSQWVAEEMIRRAMNRGVRASVYRPGHIIGDVSRGLGNNDDFVARLVHGSKSIGAWPKLPDQSKLLVPVDHVVAILLRISRKPLTIGHCYNVVPPEDKQLEHLDAKGLFAALSRQGLRMIELPFGEWVERLEGSTDVMKNRLFPLLPMLKQTVHKDLSTWELYENMPIYSTKNTDWALGIGNEIALSFPVLDDEYIHKCLGVWAQA